MKLGLISLHSYIGHYSLSYEVPAGRFGNKVVYWPLYKFNIQNIAGSIPTTATHLENKRDGTYFSVAVHSHKWSVISGLLGRVSDVSEVLAATNLHETQIDMWFVLFNNDSI